MSLLARYFGERKLATSGQLVANAEVENPLSLQVLFLDPLDLDADGLTLAMRGYAPDLSRAQVELERFHVGSTPDAVTNMIPSALKPPSLIGLAGWDNHIVQIVGINAPMPREVLESTVVPAPYDAELKDRAVDHQSHVLLFYAGYDPDPIEQYVALAAVAAALGRFGALLILNEAAHASIPAEMILVEDGDEDMLALLRELPIPLLYGGFVPMPDDDGSGVWFRTFGNPLLGLPDLAHHAPGFEQGQFVFDIFTNVLEYLRESSKPIHDGDSIALGEEVNLLARIATDAEPFLLSMGEMFVLELMDAPPMDGIG